MFGSSGVPEIFRGITFESWVEQHVLHGGRQGQARRVVEMIRRWLSGEVGGQDRNLLLIGSNPTGREPHGSVGAGKSGLSVCAMWEAGKAGTIVQFVNLADLFLSLRGAFNRDDAEGASERAQVLALAEVELLVLDDLVGKHIDSAYARSILYQILDHRYRHGRRTILNANVTSVEQLEGLLEPPTFDRATYRSMTVPLPPVNLRLPLTV